MKILHIAKFYPPVPGGMETFVHDLAVAQAAQGHAVRVLAHQDGFARPTCREAIRGVAVGRVRSFGQAAYVPITPEYPLHLQTLLRRFQPDAIHAHLPNASAFWLLPQNLPCPLLLHWHADVVASALDRKMGFLYHFYRPLETLLLKRADRVIATSRAYRDTSKPLAGFKDKTRVVPLGIDPSRLAGAPGARDPEALEPEAGNPETAGAAFTVLSVGRFAYYKGFEYLVRAAERVAGVRFVLVGDGPRFSAVKKLVRQKGLEGRVRLPGQVDADRLRALFAACDLFCLPSVERTEAFGMVLLEAMSLGKPLVTTRVPGSGMNAVNVHGVTGLQVPPADADALAAAIETLHGDRAGCRQMGAAARRRFEGHFSISSVEPQITSLYKI